MTQKIAARTIAGAALLMAALLIVAGCASKKSPAAAASAQSVATPAPASTQASSPAATINITYAKSNDSLLSMAVTKYEGAEVVASRKDETVVRFNGGVPVWVIRADRGLIGKVPGFQGVRLQTVSYGQLPKGFEETTPDSGPPEPLEVGRFYVFSVNRESGSQDFEVVKVLSDGSLAAYSAEPRAGDSYMLCCNVSSDFAESVAAPALPTKPTEVGTEPPQEQEAP